MKTWLKPINSLGACEVRTVLDSAGNTILRNNKVLDIRRQQ